MYVHVWYLHKIFPILFKSRDSSVGVARGYRLDDRGFRIQFSAGAENFSLHHRVQNGSAAHPVSFPMGSGPGALTLRLKRTGREADHSPPSSSEVKNAWGYTCIPQYAFMAWCLVKAQG
jgi:hypothetical protein